MANCSGPGRPVDPALRCPNGCAGLRSDRAPSRSAGRLSHGADAANPAGAAAWVVWDGAPDGPPARRLRAATVVAAEQVTPRTRRITVAGPELAGLVVVRPAQWVKVFVPARGAEVPVGRAYTIRRFDPHDARMELDFVLHGDGFCASWACQVQPGQSAILAGPRAGFDLHAAPAVLLGGDETALPAIAGILAALLDGVPAQVFIEGHDHLEQQALPTRAQATVRWLSRYGAAAGTTQVLQQARAATAVPSGARVWMAGEASAARAVLRHFSERTPAAGLTGYDGSMQVREAALSDSLSDCAAVSCVRSGGTRSRPRSPLRPRSARPSPGTAPARAWRSRAPPGCPRPGAGR